MTLTRALVEILLSPYPESQSTTSIFDVAAVEGSPSVRLDGSCLVPTESATPTGELIKGSLARASHTSGPYGHRPDCGIGGNGVAPESLALLPPSQTNGAVAQWKTGERTSPAEQEPSKLRVAGSIPASPSTIDRHGDDRFTDNILRALDGLPQHGDDEEERDAAEEGALIEASGYPDPAYERNGR